jgi:hypothetical protein
MARAYTHKRTTATCARAPTRYADVLRVTSRPLSLDQRPLTYITTPRILSPPPAPSPPLAVPLPVLRPRHVRPQRQVHVLLQLPGTQVGRKTYGRGGASFDKRRGARGALGSFSIPPLFCRQRARDRPRRIVRRRGRVGFVCSLAASAAHHRAHLTNTNFPNPKLVYSSLYPHCYTSFSSLQTPIPPPPP